MCITLAWYWSKVVYLYYQLAQTMTHTTPKIKVNDVVSFYIIEKEETGFKKTRHSGVVIDVFGGGFQIANADFKQGKCIPVENFICKF